VTTGGGSFAAVAGGVEGGVAGGGVVRVAGGGLSGLGAGGVTLTGLTGGSTGSSGGIGEGTIVRDGGAGTIRAGITAGVLASDFRHALVPSAAKAASRGSGAVLMFIAAFRGRRVERPPL
jgi:hypothetical protein